MATRSILHDHSSGIGFSIKAKDIQPGDIFDGHFVQVVDVCDMVTVLHFGIGRTYPLGSDADVYIRRDVSKATVEVGGG